LDFIWISATRSRKPVLNYGVSFLLVAALFQLADGGQIIGVNNLRGLGDTTVPLFYARSATG
jgi:MATE family multidrug resistance protein